MGINGNNTYYIIYDFMSELIFGVTMRGKSIPLTWIHILLTCIAPHDTHRHIIRLDLGGETGKNLEIAAMFLKHNHIMQPTGAGASSKNVMGERPHQITGITIRAIFSSANSPNIGSTDSTSICVFTRSCLIVPTLYPRIKQ
jgi:hypothetical protein